MKKGSKTYDEFCEILTQRFETLSNQLKDIARYVLDRPNEVALNTASNLAKKIGVQPSSLIRFAQALGFDGFSEVQSILRNDLLKKLPGYTPNYAERIEQMHQAADGPAPVENIINQFADVNKAALDHLCYSIEPEHLQSAVTMLDRAANIHILGQRRSFPAASYLYYGLSQLDRRAYLIDSVGGLINQQVKMVETNDVLIAITFPQYSAELVEAVISAREKKCAIVAITDGPLSPIASMSDQAFYVDKATSGGFRSVSATMCLIQAMVISLGQAHSAD